MPSSYFFPSDRQFQFGLPSPRADWDGDCVCVCEYVLFFQEDFKCIENQSVEFSEELSRPQYSPSTLP